MDPKQLCKVILTALAFAVWPPQVLAADSVAGILAQSPGVLEWQRKAHRLWEELLEAGPSAPHLRGDQDVFNYWAEVGHHCRPLAERIAKPGEHQWERIQFYAGQLGRHGADADMRWLLAQPRLWIPNGNWGGDGEPTHLMCCRALVEKFAQDEDYLRRYYHAVVWDRWFIAARRSSLREEPRIGLSRVLSRADELERDFRKHRSEAAWWRAYRFCLLAWATHRYDLVRGLDAGNLEPRFQEWRHWFAKHAVYLRAQSQEYRWRLDHEAERNKRAIEKGKNTMPAPNLPFSDWKVSPPPPRSIVGALREYGR